MSARSRLWLDLGMFAVLLAAFNPTWTGLAIHEWLSLAAIVPLLVHCIVNWEWTVRVVTTFVDRMLHASRVNLLVDAALFVSCVGVMLSGLMVSQVIASAIGLPTSPSPLWISVHATTANTTIALLIAHFALHWQWLSSVASRLVPTR